MLEWEEISKNIKTINSVRIFKKIDCVLYRFCTMEFRSTDISV